MLPKKFAHYEVLGSLGAGGMGHVYRARDTKLGRELALKVLRSPLASDPERLRRFEQEARSASALNHPNIVTIYEIGEVEGAPYIAMELVEGNTLRELLVGGPLVNRRALDFAAQATQGLAAAHAAGIVHRDLKPENIMVTNDGRVKILDFGLAKPAFWEGSDDASTGSLVSPDRPGTEPGTILGTVGYMSPEQAMGRPVDFRSDQFSCGSILYEMATGRPPFKRETAVQTLSAIIEDEPEPIASLNPNVPAPLRWISERCLAKDPSDRYASTWDLARDLRAMRDHLAEVSSVQPILAEPPSPRPPARRPWRFVATASTAAAALAGLAVVAVWGPHRVGRSPLPARPATLALLPLAYEGPEQSAHLKHLVPVVVGEDLKSSGGLSVAPFASSRTFGAEEDARSVGQQLGVAWVVEGRIKVKEKAFEASLRLLGSQDGAEAWSKKFGGDVQTVLAATDRIASDLARALGAGWTKPEAPGLSGNAKALEQYLEGKRLLEGWDVAKNYLRAEEAFRRAIQVDDNFAEAHAGLAQALWRRYEQMRVPEVVEPALAEARRAVSLAPWLPEAHLALGVIQLGRGSSAEAAASFRKAEDLAPADDDVARRIAAAHVALGRDDDAERFYQRAIDLRPGYWYNYNAKGNFHLKKGKLAPAKELFRKVIELRPDSDMGYSNLAGAYILAGELREAEPMLEAALRIHPTSRAHNNLGFVYYATGRFDEAAKEFQLAIETGEGGFVQAVLYANLGDAYRQLDHMDKARVAYARAIEYGEARLRVNPADSEARAGLSISLAGVGRCGEARRHAARSTAETPANPRADYYAAVAYAVCGDRAAALRHTIRAINGGVVADVRTNPDLRPLLGDPSIVKLLR